MRDSDKLERVLRYFNMFPDLGVVLRAEEGLKVMGNVDASFAVHPDMKGQSGLVITLGSGLVNVASGEMVIEHKGTEQMLADGMTKPQHITSRKATMVV